MNEKRRDLVTDESEVANQLTRRSMLYLAGAAAVGLVPGCGGTTSGSIAPIGNQTVGVAIKAPPGLPAGAAELLNGMSVAKNAGTQASLQVRSGAPSLVLLRNSTNGKAVMVGMVDPSAPANTLDATNVAATLVFMAIGGSELPASYRSALWKAVLKDPAVPGFAAIVKARTDANATALDDIDPQIKTGLEACVAALQQATKDLARPKPGAAPGLAGRDTLPLPPSPEVSIDFSAIGDIQVIGHELDGTLLDDIVVALYSPACEAVLNIYETARKLQDFTIVRSNPWVKVAGPLSLERTADLRAKSQPFTVPLATATDRDRLLQMVATQPIFDSPDPDWFSEPECQPFIQTWRSAVVPLFPRAAVMVANTLFFEALGLGDGVFDTSALTTQVAGMRNLGGEVAASLTRAGQGKDFAGVVNSLVTAATATDAVASETLRLLQPFTTVAIPPTKEQIALLRKVAKLGLSYQLMSLVGGNGRLVTDLTYSSVNDRRWATRFFGDVARVIYTLKPASTKYSPGNGTVRIDVENEPKTQAKFRRYEWKLFGAGSATLADDNGKTGRELTTTKPFVSFKSAPNASGVQSISCTIRNTEGSSVVLAGSAHTDLNEGTATNYTLELGTAVTAQTKRRFYVGINGNTNIDLTNMSFVWEIDESAEGRLLQGNVPVLTTTTSQNWVDFQVNDTVIDDNSSPIKCTVRKVDPNTQQFTNLAVLTGRIQYSVGTGCTVVINSMSLDSGLLHNPAVVRYWKAIAQSIPQTGAGYDLLATYGPRGQSTGGDYGAFTLRVPSSVKPGDRITIVANDPQNVLSTAVLQLGQKATNGNTAYGFVMSGTGQVTQVVRNQFQGNRVTYVKCSFLLDGVENHPGNGNTLQVQVTLGIGI